MNKARDHEGPFEMDDEARAAWEEAVALAKQGRYADSLTIFIRLANDGCEGAAYVVGNLFEAGVGDVTRDLQQAEIWGTVRLTYQNGRRTLHNALRTRRFQRWNRNYSGSSLSGCGGVD